MERHINSRPVRGVWDLPPQQAQILARLANGETLKEMALEMGLSAKTVHYHYMQLRRRLNIWSVAMLTRFAIQIGLVDMHPEDWRWYLRRRGRRPCTDALPGCVAGKGKTQQQKKERKDNV